VLGAIAAMMTTLPKPFPPMERPEESAFDASEKETSAGEIKAEGSDQAMPLHVPNQDPNTTSGAPRQRSNSILRPRAGTGSSADNLKYSVRPRAETDASNITVSSIGPLSSHSSLFSEPLGSGDGDDAVPEEKPKYRLSKQETSKSSMKEKRSNSAKDEGT